MEACSRCCGCASWVAAAACKSEAEADEEREGGGEAEEHPCCGVAEATAAAAEGVAGPAEAEPERRDSAAVVVAAVLVVAASSQRLAETSAGEPTSTALQATTQHANCEASAPEEECLGQQPNWSHSSRRLTPSRVLLLCHACLLARLAACRRENSTS